MEFYIIYNVLFYFINSISKRNKQTKKNCLKQQKRDHIKILANSRQIYDFQR